MARLGRKDWTAGAQVAAADMDGYLMEQTVMQFATSAARDTALASILDEGLLTTQADSNCLTAYSGAAWSTTGPLWGAGISWTPAVVQSGSVAATVTNAVYWRLGRLVTATCRLDVTGTGTGATGITISLPVTAAAANRICGSGVIFDTSASTFYSGMALEQSTTTCSIIPHNSTSSLGAAVFTAALASGDVIYLNLQYEASTDA